jgi:hypothetical protein
MMLLLGPSALEPERYLSPACEIYDIKIFISREGTVALSIEMQDREKQCMCIQKTWFPYQSVPLCTAPSTAENHERKIFDSVFLNVNFSLSNPKTASSGNQEK